MPFFVLHGEADTVTDPEISRALYEQASSTDKTIKTYPGMWHGLTSGEPDDNVELVFADMISWLDKRSVSSDLGMVESVVRASCNDTMEGISRKSALTLTANRKQSQRAKVRGSYLCGLKGRRLLHHSAM